MAKRVMRGRPKPGFWWADNEIIDVYGAQIGATAVAVYSVLARFAGDQGECHPAIPTIAGKLGLADNTVKKALRTLEGAGLIEIEQRPGGKNGRDRTHIYRLPQVNKQPQTTGSGQVGQELTRQDLTPKKKDRLRRAKPLSRRIQQQRSDKWRILDGYTAPARARQTATGKG